MYVTGIESSGRPATAPPSGWCLLVVVRGSGTLMAPGRRRQRVEAGELALLESGKAANFLPDPQRGCRVHRVDFAGETVARWTRAGFFGPLPRVLRTGFDESLLSLVARLVELARSQPPGASRLMAGALAHLLARLELSARPGSDTGSQHRLVREASQLLSDPDRDRVALESLTEELGVSYSWFRRCFRAHTGTSPQRFRLLQRLDRACQLLADTDLPIGAIAHRLEFSSQAYFARMFRKETGLSPTVWRNHQPAR